MKRAMSSLLAPSTSVDDRITSITSSMLASAMRRPARMWALSRAFLSLYSERRVTTSLRKSMKCCNACFRFTTFGLPPTRASMFTEKELCNAVNLYRLLRITRG